MLERLRKRAHKSALLSYNPKAQVSVYCFCFAIPVLLNPTMLFKLITCTLSIMEKPALNITQECPHLSWHTSAEHVPSTALHLFTIGKRKLYESLEAKLPQTKATKPYTLNSSFHVLFRFPYTPLQGEPDFGKP